MRLHNDVIDKLLSDYLPTHYSTEVVRRLAGKGVQVSADVVRNVRNGRNASAINSAAIIKVLLELANEEKIAQEAVSNLINSSHA